MPQGSIGPSRSRRRSEEFVEQADVHQTKSYQNGREACHKVPSDHQGPDGARRNLLNKQMSTRGSSTSMGRDSHSRTTSGDNITVL
jgi:hypothetical protein